MRFLRSGLQEILFLAALIGVLVLGIYFLLPALEWKWDSDKLTLDLEKRFGDMLVEEVKNDPTYYNDETVSKALATMEKRLTNAVTNLPFPVRILVVRNSAVNAFTFPGGVILVHTGLLARSDSAEEVAGVLAHELGHVANRDTLKALYRQVGLSLIVAVVTGGRSDQIQDLVTQLISIKFTRTQEGLADDYAIGLLIKAGINPEYLARFFEKLKKQQSDVENFAKFLNTHPDTEGRMKKARDAGKKFDPKKTNPLGINWTQVKKKLPSLLSQ